MGKRLWIGVVAVQVSVLGLIAGCGTTSERVLDSDQNQVQLRQMQTRAFDTTDRPKMIRTVMATLQDLGFVIDSANQELGTVTGTKLDGYALRMTVSVRERGTSQLAVRANAQFNVTPVTDPRPYQQFFTSLEKALFLTAQQVD